MLRIVGIRIDLHKRTVPRGILEGIPFSVIQADLQRCLAAIDKAQEITAGKREWESSASIRDMIVAYFGQNSPVSPETDGNWRITGVDLNEDDPRRAELIGYINEGLLPVPYNRSYNLADYDSLVALAEENRIRQAEAE